MAPPPTTREIVHTDRHSLVHLGTSRAPCAVARGTRRGAALSFPWLTGPNPYVPPFETQPMLVAPSPHVLPFETRHRHPPHPTPVTNLPRSVAAHLSLQPPMQPRPSTNLASIGTGKEPASKVTPALVGTLASSVLGDTRCATAPTSHANLPPSPHAHGKGPLTSSPPHPVSHVCRVFNPSPLAPLSQPHLLSNPPLLASSSQPHLPESLFNSSPLASLYQPHFPESLFNPSPLASLSQPDSSSSSNPCVIPTPTQPTWTTSSPSRSTMPCLSDCLATPTFSDISGLPPVHDLSNISISTPINTTRLSQLLVQHPHRELASFLLESLTNGFRIGYQGQRFPVHSPNLFSAFLHPEMIDRALIKELHLGRIAGLFNSPPFRVFRSSGLGLVPKDTTDWRLIFHLSAPLGQSVNDFIPLEDFSLHYTSIDDATAILHTLGQGAWMAKADLKSAFRLCLVHPSDRPLLGFTWRNQYFFDKCLPFGLRSSPYLFNQLAETLQWCLSFHHSVRYSFHYLDDYFFAGPPSSVECNRALTAFQTLCGELAIPLKPETLVRPTTSMTFLGIQLDSVSQMASLPEDKLQPMLAALRQHIVHYRAQTPVTKRSLLSLIGKLSFASKVIPAGRIFIRRLLDLAHSIQALDSPLHLTSPTTLDINWWLVFASTWNGKAFFMDPTWTHSPDMSLFTDASSEIGLGAFWNGRWFQ